MHETVGIMEVRRKRRVRVVVVGTNRRAEVSDDPQEVVRTIIDLAKQHSLRSFHVVAEYRGKRIVVSSPEELQEVLRGTEEDITFYVERAEFGG